MRYLVAALLALVVVGLAAQTTQAATPHDHVAAASVLAAHPRAHFHYHRGWVHPPVVRPPHVIVPFPGHPPVVHPPVYRYRYYRPYPYHGYYGPRGGFHYRGPGVGVSIGW